MKIASTSSQDNPINIRFYNPKTSSTTPRSQDNLPETPSSRRRIFQSRPSRLSNVYTPTIETPVTNQSSRRTRRTAALETPKSEVSNIEIPDSVESTGWAVDQDLGSFETEQTTDGPSSPTSASEMRNSSRVRKPTRRALESLETSKRVSRRKNTAASTPAPERPDPLSVKIVKNNVAKKPTKKTRLSKKITNSSIQKDAVLIGFDIDAKVVGKILYDLSVEALKPGFILPSDFPAFYDKARNDYYHRQKNENHGTDTLADQSTASTDVEMVDKDLPAAPKIPLSTPTPNATPTRVEGILGYRKLSEASINGDGWVETGRFNDQGEEVSLCSDQYHPHFATNSYGYEGLPWPPVRARSSQQAVTESAHGFPPLMGSRNIPSDGMAPFLTENVQEEQARVLANVPAPAPEHKSKKPRARKRRQTETAATAQIEATTPNGERKSQRRRRQTAPAPIGPPHSPLSSPPTTAKKVQSGPAAAVTPAATKGDKPKVQRLRLTLKPVPNTESPRSAFVSAEVPARQFPSSSAPSGAPSPAPTNKRRRRRG